MLFKDCNLCGKPVDVGFDENVITVRCSSCVKLFDDIDAMAVRYAEVLEELKNVRESRAGSLEIIEEKRERIRVLEDRIDRAMAPIHTMRGRGIGRADDVLDEVAEILEEKP